jgi:hypothetical protein
MAGAMGDGPPLGLDRNSSSGSVTSSAAAAHEPKHSYWAQDSQGGDVVYTTDTLLRCVWRT